MGGGSFTGAWLFYPFLLAVSVYGIYRFAVWFFGKRK
jgi:hypothetical protein